MREASKASVYHLWETADRVTKAGSSGPCAIGCIERTFRARGDALLARFCSGDAAGQGHRSRPGRCWPGSRSVGDRVTCAPQASAETALFETLGGSDRCTVSVVTRRFGGYMERGSSGPLFPWGQRDRMTGVPGSGTVFNRAVHPLANRPTASRPVEGSGRGESPKPHLSPGPWTVGQTANPPRPPACLQGWMDSVLGRESGTGSRTVGRNGTGWWRGWPAVAFRTGSPRPGWFGPRPGGLAPFSSFPLLSLS